jgi:hypothetical protein
MQTLAIGAAGELLVQYKLLKSGIDSARMTTDSGIDLVMYVPGLRGGASTVQVKTQEAPGRAGGKGGLTLGWRFPHSCPADWLACVDLSSDRAWLFRTDEARELAQQHNPGGTRLLYWYINDLAPAAARRERDIGHHRLELIATQLLGESGQVDH